ncbi:dTDP-4-dehydrorhamnose reductase [Persephonella sp.]
MKYLILGKNGQLGQAFQKALKKENKDFLALSHQECDISDLNKVLEIFNSYKPDIVLNCAAYNLVDKAEEEYWNSYKTNALGVRNLAYASSLYNAYFVTYSTDYVFDGEKENGLYTEEDIPNPINEYGKGKLTGEKWVMEENLKKSLILRTSWVYGEGKQNFIYKLMQWAENSKYLKIAYDEVSVPTSTRTIVDVSLKAVEQGLTGLYHLTNSGYASRYEWAKKILELKGIKKFIYPVSKDIFNLPAKRPKFSAMDNGIISKKLNLEIPFWDKEVELFFK